jgi:hypothetical protein
MAIWQFTTHLAANSELRRYPERLRAPDTPPTDEDWWAPRAIDPSALALLESAPPGASWSPQMRAWGADDSNHVEVSDSEHGFVIVRIRFDLRNPDPAFIRFACRLALATDCSFLSEDGTVVAPAEAALITALQRSPAARFAADPMGFIRALPKHS